MSAHDRSLPIGERFGILVTAHGRNRHSEPVHDENRFVTAGWRSIAVAREKSGKLLNLIHSSCPEFLARSQIDCVRKHRLGIPSASLYAESYLEKYGIFVFLSPADLDISRLGKYELVVEVIGDDDRLSGQPAILKYTSGWK